MSTAIELFQNYGLLTKKLSYSETTNSFYGQAYTSLAGNSYFNSMRLAEGLIIKEDVGIAHWGTTYLNGIQIYSTQSQSLIADEKYHACKYSISIVKVLSKRMLMDKLRESANVNNMYLDESEAEKIINKVIDQAIDEDQRNVLLKQKNKYLK
jgi:hypothetical protein